MWLTKYVPTPFAISLAIDNRIRTFPSVPLVDGFASGMIVDKILTRYFPVHAMPLHPENMYEYISPPVSPAFPQNACQTTRLAKKLPQSVSADCWIRHPKHDCGEYTRSAPSFHPRENVIARLLVSQIKVCLRPLLPTPEPMENIEEELIIRRGIICGLQQRCWRIWSWDKWNVDYLPDLR